MDCDKGRFAHAWVNDENRLATPQLRKNGKLVPVQWSEALAYIANRLTVIKEKYGADSIGAIGSGKISNESNYALQRFMRAVIGTNNIDHRDGGEVAALPTGLPALTELMKPQYGPDPQVDTVLLFGLDPSEELPVLDLHLKRAILRGGVNLIVAHPRRIELTRYDGPYLAYLPGGESSLVESLLQAVQDSGPSAEESAIDAAANLLKESERTLIVYGPMAARGESGPGVREGLARLAQAAGDGTRLAYVGLDGNAQGCRDTGVLPDRLPGQFPLDDVDARSRLEALWGCDLSTSPGYTYKQMLDSQEMKALFVNGANPAAESPDWAAGLEELELLVATDLLPTETAQRADVVLPAQGWAESDGTYTNLDRRVQRAPKAITDPKSRAAPDWMIFTHLAKQMGANWPFSDAHSVTAEITRAVPAYADLTWDALGDQGRQWDADSAPVAEASAGRASEGTSESSDDDAEYPLSLVTGTVLYDGGTLFSLTDQMHGMAHGTTVTLNPIDAAESGLDAGSAVTVRSEQGNLDLTLAIDAQVQTGCAWIPESLPGAPVGALLNGSFTQRVKVERR